MKKINILLILIVVFVVNGCEDVVNIDLQTDSPKLVIEASINWYKGTTGKEQKIKLTTTTNYYSDIIPKVSGAIVSIKNSSNTTFLFTEIANTGVYTCSNFIAVINESYTLTIINAGDTYTAVETLKSVAPISEIIQNNEGGFTGKDIEIKTYFTDPVNETNYYLYNYHYSNQVKQNYYADEDTFFQGNKFFSISQSDDLKTSDEITVTHYGISKSYYNYMNVLISIAGSSGGGPFQSPPATVRGNIINTTNPDNYPLGYFSISEADSAKYIIK
ncbi:DUF4249 domain-containing protein [Flavobacterium frigoris]|uniref:DUF4249 domain-containing protein n=1 Tax=Flavobacterium frigoris (strain PS1) TaxID=1086011 RepID=H7FT75_FLAFP|nr:DUF4249 domain-containing protein [Flavobacterium frigoris]EIA08129.1 hypothetical protein HJ01_01851 [Flavobacterium frigoris PS1]